MGSLPLQKSDVLAALSQHGVGACSQALPAVFDTVPEDLVVEEKLCHGVAEENHDTWPEEPVSGTRNVVRATHTRQAVVRDISIPMGVIGHNLLTGALTRVHKQGAYEAPGDEAADEVGDTDVEADEETRPYKCRSPLDEPTPTLDVDSEALEVAPDEDPSEDMPVPQDAEGVVRDDPEDKGRDERDAEGLDLLDRLLGAGPDSVHRSDRESGGGGRGEDEAEVARDVDDEELAQRHGEEQTEERPDQGEGHVASVIVLHVLGQQLQVVHGG